MTIDINRTLCELFDDDNTPIVSINFSYKGKVYLV